MGQDFRNSLTTNSGVQNNGQTTFYGNPAQAAIQAAKQTVAPTVTAQESGYIPQVSGYTQPRPIQAGQPDFQSVPTPQPDPTFVQGDAANSPLIVKPSFTQASQDKYGNAKLGSGLTKGGMLLGILKAGLQGGIDAAQGGALDAVRGRSSFGAGMEAADTARRHRQAEFNRQQELDTENQLKQQAIQQGPVLFNAKVAQDLAAAQEQKARAGFYDTLTTNKGKSVADLTSEAIAAGYAPGSPEFNQHVFGKPLQESGPKTDAQLRYAAANGDKDAQAAIDDREAERKRLQRPIKGSAVDTGQAGTYGAKFMNAAGNDPNKALGLLNQFVASGDPEAVEVAKHSKGIQDYIRKNGAVKGTNTKSATPGFINAVPQS